ncbi:E3 SUMO-protein ligase NSE2-like [Discoglossus pictus]
MHVEERPVDRKSGGLEKTEPRHRDKMSSRTASLISFNFIDNSLSSVKNCKNYISTGMDLASEVAIDLLQNGCDMTDVNSMETVMLEYAAMDRDLNQYANAVEETVNRDTVMVASLPARDCVGGQQAVSLQIAFLNTASSFLLIQLAMLEAAALHYPVGQ